MHVGIGSIIFLGVGEVGEKGGSSPVHQTNKYQQQFE